MKIFDLGCIILCEMVLAVPAFLPRLHGRKCTLTTSPAMTRMR
jgi:hypothetical protein